MRHAERGGGAARSRDHLVQAILPACSITILAGVEVWRSTGEFRCDGTSTSRSSVDSRKSRFLLASMAW